MTRGFTLLELLITVAVLAVILAWAIEALNLAEQKLEWFRTRGATASSAIAVANFDGDSFSCYRDVFQYGVVFVSKKGF